jgi:hypothetical protein
MTIEIHNPELESMLQQQLKAGNFASVEDMLLQTFRAAPLPAAEHERPPSRSRRHIADVICENMQDVPPEIMASMPQDGASQHDHYIYGWPKKEA